MDNRLDTALPPGNRGSLNNCILIVLIYLLVFQNPLERISSIFKFTDELFALAAVPILVISSVKRGRLKIKHYIGIAVIPLTVFVVTGLWGNVLYQYQPWKLVLTDLFTNLKFFLTLMSGYALAPLCMNRSASRLVSTHLRLICVLIFALFCVERITPVFGMTEVRYGLRTAQMIFGHATYLAGAMAFLIAALTVFYEKKNLPFIAIALLMLMFTLRSKAIVSAMVYVLLFLFIIVIKGKLKLWHIAVLGAAAVVIGWQQISFYFIELGGGSARSVMTMTSFEIMADYFPIGTGFGTYASHVAGTHYSPVYVQYGFEEVYELSSTTGMFFDDTFWPIIIGQTGFIGTLAYLALLSLIFSKVFYLKKVNNYWFVAGLFILIYTLISSTAEPAFNNAVSIPLAVILGGLIRLVEYHRYADSCKSTSIFFQ